MENDATEMCYKDSPPAVLSRSDVDATHTVPGQ
jgi:hypothetical protein